VVAAPVQAFALLLGGRVIFAGSPRLRPTVAADLAAIASHPADSVVLLIALAAGGLTLGVLAARVDGRARSKTARG
jgi:hypothetical protein